MATVQPAQAGRCGCAVMGGMSLKPSAVSKKYISGNTMAVKLHQIWNCGEMGSIFFIYLIF